jgi:hypothetical protein
VVPLCNPRLPLLMAAAGFLATACYGQERWDDVNFRSASIGGIHLYGVSVYSAYSTSATPYSGSSQLYSTAYQNLQSDVNYGVQWTAGWQRQREKSSVVVRYLGSYGGQTRYTELNAFGHSLSINVNRKLNTKWSVNFSVSGDYRTFAQFLFQPTSLSILSQTPATFDDLAAAFSLGQFSSPQVASMLTGTPVVASPERTLLTGDRVLTYYGTATATYAYSSRLSFQFSGVGAGGQNTLGGNQSFVIPRTFGANAGVNLSYSLSPRTTVGATLLESRNANRFQSSYNTSAAATFGRKMGLHWFLSMNGGMSYLKSIQQTYGEAPASRQIIGGGSLGYRTYAHTIMASYSRASSDTFGIATGVVTGAHLAWSWRRPGSGWMFFATGGQQQIRNTGYTSLSGWSGSGGVSRRLSSQLSWRTEYTYLLSTGNYLGLTSDRSIQSVRVSLAWGPEIIPNR